MEALTVGNQYGTVILGHLVLWGRFEAKYDLVCIQKYNSIQQKKKIQTIVQGYHWQYFTFFLASSLIIDEGKVSLLCTGHIVRNPLRHT